MDVQLQLLRGPKALDVPEELHAQVKSISAGMRKTLREVGKEMAEDWVRKHSPQEKVAELAK